MVLLLDIGNTNTHLGLGNSRKVVRQANISTASWANKSASELLKRFVGSARLEGAILCSVVPRVTGSSLKAIRKLWNLKCLLLTSGTLSGIGIDYPKQNTIGPDRLANAIAAHHQFGAPVIVIDFGTAVTIDVVNRAGDFIGGIIAPGPGVMTDYLHEKTALLPKIEIRQTRSAIGKSTEEAMTIGAVHGYRGMIRELLEEVRRKLKTRRLPIVATGGYAQLMASQLPQISAVRPFLTLDGIRLVWHAHHLVRS